MDKLRANKKATIFISDDVELGEDVIFFGFNNIYGCKIGKRSRIGTFVEIQKGATIGRNCKISSHTFICEGVTIEDNCFIGHGVVFINDRYPAAVNQSGELKAESDWVCESTRVKEGASIGSGAIVMCGITIGKNALIGAGALVTKDVPDGAVVAGFPSRELRKSLKDNSQN